MEVGGVALCGSTAALVVQSAVASSSSGLTSPSTVLRHFHISDATSAVQLVSSSTVTGALSEQRRSSFKYARRPQHTEMRQPFFIHEKLHGLFSNERNIAKSRRGLPYITPLYTKHMNLWETDTDANSNRFFRSYVFGQRELHQLLGRSHGFEADEAAGKQGESAYELQTDQRFKGISTPMIRNLHFEPEWNYTLYANQAHQCNASCTQHAKTAASEIMTIRAPTEDELLGQELALSEARNMKSVEHCKAWFDRLLYLIRLHYDAVGDIGEFKSRHTQHVHAFFVSFHDAISSFDFQDSYLFQQFQATRPKELEDIFGIFLEMEANYVHPDYCPRCSLPYATTRYCGEGDETTPFRRHRGRWAPHQQWGKEWYDVVTRRAEALWYRATEDPYFGVARHTQRQVEGLLRVYCQTKQRAKAVDFMHRIRGSFEFLTGVISITPSMEEQMDHLLDTTDHPHLLTNNYHLRSRTSIYTGEVNKVPHSPLQMLLDMKLNIFRRQQREEGVIRIPPASWKINTSSIVPYQLDSETKQVINWREVKEGIEKAFLDSGLGREAYTAEEWRWLSYWKTAVATKGAERAALEIRRRKDEESMKKSGKASKMLLFPTAHWYQVFDTSPEALAPFANSLGLSRRISNDEDSSISDSSLASGSVFVFTTKQLLAPKEVVYEDKVHHKVYTFNTTDEACRVFGDFVSGEVIRIIQKGSVDTGIATSGKLHGTDVVVVGVHANDPVKNELSLYAMYLDSTLNTERGLVELGKNSEEVHRTIYGENVSAQHTQELGRQHRLSSVFFVEDQRRKDASTEESLGQIVGVRNGNLYIQWRLLAGGGGRLDRSVAVPVGSPAMVKSMFTVKAARGIEPLQEPPSWWVPFRNDHAEERLKEAVEAPFKRESWGSLISGKYTPKVKRFGYTQHSTQDDFMTKEYRDRLLSKQFFNKPQMFAVIPERQETSVQFGGKWEHQRVCGFPSVDRNELENGWAENDFPISEAEANVVEQAIRDISGTKPGNYIKTPSETQSLQLNESWWTPLQFGWEERNRSERTFNHRLEQSLVDSGKLPFQGTIPPFGTSYGIGERIREIARDYSKGFGLGANGHTSGHNQVLPGGGMDEHTLEREVKRVQTLGLGNALVRLFDDKIATSAHAGDVYSWAMEISSGGGGAWSSLAGIPVKSLLLSLQEWREKGRMPSVLLQRVLSVYLKDELDIFNEGLPAEVPKLRVASVENSATDGSGAAGGQIWAAVDPTQYGYDYVRHRQQQQHQDSIGTSFVVDLVHGACNEACFKGGQHGFSMSVDERSKGALLDKVTSNFQLALAKVANKGISASLINQQTSNTNKGRGVATAIPYVKCSEVANVLTAFGVSSENISVVVKGLSSIPEAIASSTSHHVVSGGSSSIARTDDAVVPVSAVLTWGGPKSTAGPASGVSGGNSSSSSSNRKLYNASAGKSLKSSSAGSNQDGTSPKMIVHVLEELTLYHDGFVADLNYGVQQNLRNPVLRQEFMQTFLPVFGGDAKLTAQRYEAYTCGKYVPNVTEAIDAFVKFLVSYAMKSDSMRAAAAVDYFVELPSDAITTSSGLRTSPQSSVVYESPPRIRLLPPELGSFQFENTLLEVMETARLFTRYGITAGPNGVKPVLFISPNSSSTNYFADNNRQAEMVQVIPKGTDYGMMAALKSSPHIEKIKACPLLQPMLTNITILIVNFNRFFQRVLPMLHVYQQVLLEYNRVIADRKYEAEESKRELGKLMEAELHPALEQEFRRNSERYWRNVLEGRTGDDMIYGGGGGGTGARQALYQSQRSRSGVSAVTRNRSQAASSSAKSSASVPHGSTVTSSGTANKPSPSAAVPSTSTKPSASASAGRGGPKKSSAATVQDLFQHLRKK